MSNTATQDPVDDSPIIIGVTDHPVEFSLTQYERRPATTKSSGAGVSFGTTVIPSPVDLRGWDTVFAIRMPDVNKGITKYAASTGSKVPTNYDTGKQFGNVRYTATGTVSNWRMIPGGDGTVVRMALDLPAGTLTKDTPAQTWAYDSGVLSFAVNLGFIPRDPTSSTVGLQVTGLATQVQVNFTGTQPDPIVPVFLVDILQTWLDNNLEAFQYMFASVNLNAKPENADWNWLAPTAAAYAYKQPSIYAADNDCILGVLCTTNNNSATSLSAAIDTSVIPAGAKAGMVIGANAYYKNILTKHLADGFDGATIADFDIAISGGTYTIYNNKTVKMKCDGKEFEITTRNFNISMGVGEITTVITSAKHTVSAGIDLYLNYTIHTGCELKNKDDGTQALVLTDIGNIETTHTIQKAPWVTITEIIAGAIAGAILAGIGEIGGEAAVKALETAGKVAADSITGKVIKVIISTLIGILSFGIIINISNLIAAAADQNANDLPAFNPFATEAVKNVVWANTSTALFSSAGFNNGLQIGLDPKFVN